MSLLIPFNWLGLLIISGVCIYLRISLHIHMYKMYYLFSLKGILKEYIDLRTPGGKKSIVYKLGTIVVEKLGKYEITGKMISR